MKTLSPKMYGDTKLQDLSSNLYIYIYIYIYIRGVFNRFLDFFVQEFKIVVDT